jgi:predicted PurR-regulated permease PerM
MPRWLAVVTTYVVFTVGITAGTILLLAPLVRQALELVNALPGYVAGFHAQMIQIEQNLAGTAVASALDVIETQVINSLGEWSTRIVGLVVEVLALVGGSVTDGVLILIISIYMLLGGKHIHQSIHRVLPAPYNDRFLFTTDAMVSVMGGYIRSQLVLALMLGVAVTVGLALLGMPYALLLGLLAMILGLIPMFGSALSAVPALILSLTQPWPMFLWVLIFFIIVQNVQDQVLAPRIQGESVGLHPLAVLFALLAGAQLAGAMGALFAVPVAGFIWLMVATIYRSFRKTDPTLASAEELVTSDDGQGQPSEQRGVTAAGEANS